MNDEEPIKTTPAFRKNSIYLSSQLRSEIQNGLLESFEQMLHRAEAALPKLKRGQKKRFHLKNCYIEISKS
jgi:hypothetical protein